MRIAIIGRTEVLYETIGLLLENGYDIPLIITSKEAPEYTKTSKDFKELAVRINAKYLCSSTLNSIESIEFIKKCKDLDIAVSLNYSSIISQDIIDLFSLGILNAHGGDLPRYKGNACQAWAIINGEKKIGLCIHSMIGGEIDSGNIIARKYLDINISTTVTEIWHWFTTKTPALFLDAIKELRRNKDFVLEVQSKDPSDALRCYPRIPEDGKIDWNNNNLNILRLINASNKPYSGAYCFYEDKKLIIWDAEIIKDNEIYLAENGQILEINKNGYLIVSTGKGKLKIVRVEYDGFVCNPGEIVKSIRSRLL